MSEPGAPHGKGDKASHSEDAQTGTKSSKSTGAQSKQKSSPPSPRASKGHTAGHRHKVLFARRQSERLKQMAESAAETPNEQAASSSQVEEAQAEKLETEGEGGKETKPPTGKQANAKGEKGTNVEKPETVGEGGKETKPRETSNTLESQELADKETVDKEAKKQPHPPTGKQGKAKGEKGTKAEKLEAVGEGGKETKPRENSNTVESQDLADKEVVDKEAKTQPPPTGKQAKAKGEKGTKVEKQKEVEKKSKQEEKSTQTEKQPDNQDEKAPESTKQSQKDKATTESHFSETAPKVKAGRGKKTVHKKEEGGINEDKEGSETVTQEKQDADRAEAEKQPAASKVMTMGMKEQENLGRHAECEDTTELIKGKGGKGKNSRKKANIGQKETHDDRKEVESAEKRVLCGSCKAEGAKETQKGKQEKGKIAEKQAVADPTADQGEVDEDKAEPVVNQKKSKGVKTEHQEAKEVPDKAKAEQQIPAVSKHAKGGKGNGNGETKPAEEETTANLEQNKELTPEEQENQANERAEAAKERTANQHTKPKEQKIQVEVEVENPTAAEVEESKNTHGTEPKKGKQKGKKGK